MPTAEERINSAKRSLEHLADSMGVRTRDSERLIRTTVSKISAAILRGESDLSPYFDEFSEKLERIVLNSIADAVEQAVVREKGNDGGSDNLIALVLAGLNLSSPVRRYTDILRNETKFFRSAGYRTSELMQFIDNPRGYEAAHGKNLKGLAQAVPEIKSGVSWQVQRNTYGMILYDTMYAYNSSLVQMWGEKGMRGYVGFRNSTWPCELCDSLCGIVRPLTDLVFPAHVHCVCGIYEVSFSDYW